MSTAVLNGNVKAVHHAGKRDICQEGILLTPSEGVEWSKIRVDHPVGKSIIGNAWFGKYWFERNIDNQRRRKSKQLGMLLEAMKNDEYRNCGQGMICTNGGGLLLNGQHTALALSRLENREVELFFVKGVVKDAIHVMDCGSKRSLGDSLHINGYSNANNLGAAIVALMQLKENDIDRAFDPPSYPKCLLFAAEHEALQYSAAFLQKLHTKEGPLPAVGFPAALHFLMWDTLGETKLAEVDEFWEVVAERRADCSNRFSAACNLRDYLQDLKDKTREAGGQVDRRHASAVIIQGWNAFRAGKTAYELRYNKNEDLPVIIGR